jgi:hypothetical protein
MKNNIAKLRCVLERMTPANVPAIRHQGIQFAPPICSMHNSTRGSPAFRGAISGRGMRTVSAPIIHTCPPKRAGKKLHPSLFKYRYMKNPAHTRCRRRKRWKARCGSNRACRISLGG